MAGSCSSSSAEQLLQSRSIFKVLWIYLEDLRDMILGAMLAAFKLTKALLRSAVGAIKKLPKDVAEMGVQEFQHAFDTGPVPDDFDYSGMAIGHFWDYIIINAKCYGETFASSYMGHVILSKVTRSTALLFIFLHTLLPKLAFLLHRKTSMESVGLPERRFCALLLSFVIGVGTHLLYLKWQQPVLPPPPYYSQTLVVLIVEFICPKAHRSRRKFLLYPIGSATLLCIAYGIFYQQIDFIYLFSTAVAIAFTFLNLQELLGNGGWKSEYAIAYGHIALPINSMYNELICTILFGIYKPDRAPHEAIPNSLEEQYTMIAHLK